MNIDEYKISRKNWQQSVEKWENILDKMVDEKDMDYCTYWDSCGFCEETINNRDYHIRCSLCILNQSGGIKRLCDVDGGRSMLYDALINAYNHKFDSAIPIVIAFLMFLYDLEYCVYEEEK